MRQPVNHHQTKYRSDVTDKQWEFCATCLTMMREDAPQRTRPLRATFNALLCVVKTGCPWRYLPADFPPWHAGYGQTQRCLKAGLFEAMANDLRKLMRMIAGRLREPSAAILDRRTIQPAPESSSRAGCDG